MTEEQMISPVGRPSEGVGDAFRKECRQRWPGPIRVVDVEIDQAAGRAEHERNVRTTIFLALPQNLWVQMRR